MIKYLKNTGSSSKTTSLTETLITSPSFANVVTISNSFSSISTTTGALIVSGGVGISGNINAGGYISSGSNISAINGFFSSNLNVQGYTNSNYVNVPGILTASLGEFNHITTNTATINGQTITSALEVLNNGNFGSITSNFGVIEDLTSTSLQVREKITTSTLETNDLYVDNIYPNNNNQINFGDIGNIKISGGSLNRVLGTDGNGNLSWVPGTGAISVGTGLRRDGDVISLSGTGFITGTFNQVTIDEYGRVVYATNFINDLQDITSRGATTNNSIGITNNTDSISTTTGALTVSGGIGVGKTITTQNLVVKSSIQVDNQLNINGQSTFNNTAIFNASNAPLRITAGSLLTTPVTGTIEFDGSLLYVTTNFGRQAIKVTSSDLTSTNTFIARAVAARNINIANGTQYTELGEDNWDDVILEIKNVVLLTKQTNPVENGLYIWNSENTPLTRHPDFTTALGIRQGTIIFISEGLFNGGSFYKVVTPDSFVIGASPLTIVEQFNKDNIALSSLPKTSGSGLVVRSTYGTVLLRNIQSATSWITITNPAGVNGNITIETTTIPVSSGGIGRTSITGWMKGIGSSIQGTSTIPLADIAGAGTIASQNANAVVITGGTIDNVVIGSATASNASFTEVVIGGNSYSVYFDGTGDYLTILNPPLALRAWDNTNAFTIEMWIYVISSLVECTLIGNLTPGTNTWSWSFSLTTTRALRFVWKNTSGNSYAWSASPAGIISLNQWHHVAFVKDESSVQNWRNVYVDGVRVGTSTDSDGGSTGMSSAGMPIAIGVNFNGYITNLRVNADTALYTSNFTPTTVPLTPIAGTSLLTCVSDQYEDLSTLDLTIVQSGNVEISTKSPFGSGAANGTIMLNDYKTGLFRVTGDSSLNGILQVSTTIYKNGYEVLSNNDIIDGGTY